MKRHYISGHKFEIECNSAEQVKKVHELVEYQKQLNPNFVANPDDRMMAEACLYLAIAKEVGLKIKTF